MERRLFLSKNFTHLTLADRVIIEDRLRKGQSVHSIAKDLAKSPSTILREIQNNSTDYKAKSIDCAIKRDCGHRNLCGKTNCTGQCWNCKMGYSCKDNCLDYIPIICEKLKESALACNSCPKFSFCKLSKKRYEAHNAQHKSNKRLVTKRAGFDVDAEQLQIIDKLASPMIKNGCSPFHIKETYGDKIPVSEATLRRMINSSVLDARNLDLRDTVKRKERKTTKNKDRNARLTVSKIGHLYKDYLAFVNEHEVNTVEMDCVEGKKDESEVLLTLHFKTFYLQLAFIMESQTSYNVVKTLDMIEEILGTDLFMQMFPIILTDNGTEFSDISGMERSINGGQRTRIYFCEPNRSDEKGSCENHHRMIRWVIPKGTSLSPYKQEDINLMMNHINSYKRPALFGKSAIDISKGVIPEDFFILLGIDEIPPEEIKLIPELIKK